MTADSPLLWPESWPRHAAQRDSDRRFYGPKYQWDRIYRELVAELGRLGAKDIVVSSNLPVRRDGVPYANQRRIDDPGVAVYFVLNKRPMVMAQDRFDTVIGNMRSLGVAVEAMRAVQRHGGGHMLERAFSGFTALPPPSTWRRTLGFPDGSRPDRQEIADRFRQLAKKVHAAGADQPGGRDYVMANLNVARDEALAETA